MIPKLAHELIDGFAARGEVDLFTRAPTRCPSSRCASCSGWTRCPGRTCALEPGDDARAGELRGRPRTKQAPADAASAELGEAIERVLDRLAGEPDGSVLSWMLHHEGDGDRMSHEEIVANTKLMLSGGLQEPRDLIALMVWALVTHPEELDEVRADPR